MTSLKQKVRCNGTELPALPTMLLRSLPTMLFRKGTVQEPIDIELNFLAPAIDRVQLAKYCQAFTHFKSPVPLTYFYLLAQRAHLAAMLSPEFPWPILGMVHVANTMKYHHAPEFGKPLQLRVQIEMPARASTRKRIRPVYRVNFYQAQQLLVECISTYQVGAGEPPVRGRRREVPAPELPGFSVTNLWQLDSQLGRSYANLSGDYNPIHLHPWLSRWFGFSRPIIHGMYSVARAQADVEMVLQAPVIAMDIAFRRPLILPADARCHYRLNDNHEGQLVITDPKATKAYMDGSFQAATSFKFK